MGKRKRGKSPIERAARPTEEVPVSPAAATAAELGKAPKLWIARERVRAASIAWRLQYDLMSRGCRSDLSALIGLYTETMLIAKALQFGESIDATDETEPPEADVLHRHLAVASRWVPELSIGNRPRGRSCEQCGKKRPRKARYCSPCEGHMRRELLAAGWGIVRVAAWCAGDDSAAEACP